MDNNFLTPEEIAEHLKNMYPEFGGLNTEELLVMQESAFQYLQNNNQNSAYGEASRSSLVSEYGTDSASLLSLDENLAKALEMSFDNLYVHEDGFNAVENTRSTAWETPTRHENRSTQEDDIDPDSMTYEELQDLGESIGSESKGLSQDLISRLPTFKHKVGFFSKKKKKDECVICYEGYKNKDLLTTLPCAHQYHSHCITKWLQSRKQCPICQKEVKDE